MSEPHDEPEPPKREFRFKAKEFDRTNRPLDEDDVQPAIDVKTLNRQANIPAPPKPSTEALPPTENEIHALLRHNVAQATEDGFNDVIIEKRPMSRRNRDFWTLLVLGNGFIGVAMLIFTRNLTAVLGATAGMLLYTIALIWVMRFVMDDY